MGALGDAEPIIIKKRGRRSRNEHHGGAWKIAFADFAVSMMAFFLVLWLSASTTVEEQRAISGYFENPTGFERGGSKFVIDMGGAAKQLQAGDSDSTELNSNARRMSREEVENVIDAQTVEQLARDMERKRFDVLLSKLKMRIEKDSNLRPYRDQIILSVTDDGLQIQIVDRESTAMFDSGSSQLKLYTRDLIKALSATIDSVPNRISISGHTDAVAFQGRDDFSNWELSAERANAARRTLVAGGYPSGKISEVVGHASSVLFDKKNPSSARNRRISILVMSGDTDEAKRRASESGVNKVKAPTVPDVDEARLPDSFDVAGEEESTAADESYDIERRETGKTFTIEKSEFRRGWNKIIPRSKANESSRKQRASEPAVAPEGTAEDEVF
ncbi:MAG: motility protein MotB [Gammaproteobacteria bacterium]|nr:MAG: motility protein MotB [Gammaproteobacteria bacterium]